MSAIRQNKNRVAIKAGHKNPALFFNCMFFSFESHAKSIPCSTVC